MKKFMDLKNLKLNKESALIVVLAGILCLVVVWPISGKSSGTDSSNGTLSGSSSSVSSSGRISEDTAQAALELYVENQEQRLKDILEQIDGVGKSEVMIRAKASKEYVVEKDISTGSSTVSETDAQGGSRQSSDITKDESSLYTKDSNGNDVPWVIKEMEPEIEGVLVAAEGGGNEAVAGEITQAVQVLFNIPVHKIKVVKMKGE
ncbi:stage III sporulation protein AG [Frisingicoccus sp.]|uniref:stage III sporulation protein AG n=1 Tax=Frisingicoccus sp. TaxID=1918627 RepID=UPI0015BA0D67